METEANKLHEKIRLFNILFIPTILLLISTFSVAENCGKNQGSKNETLKDRDVMRIFSSSISLVNFAEVFSQFIIFLFSGNSECISRTENKIDINCVFNGTSVVGVIENKVSESGDTIYEALFYADLKPTDEDKNYISGISVQVITKFSLKGVQINFSNISADIMFRYQEGITSFGSVVAQNISVSSYMDTLNLKVKGGRYKINWADEIDASINDLYATRVFGDGTTYYKITIDGDIDILSSSCATIGKYSFKGDISAIKISPVFPHNFSILCPVEGKVQVNSTEIRVDGDTYCSKENAQNFLCNYPF